MRRKGQGGHSLELLTADEPGADVVDTVNGERAMNDRLEQILGLDFKAFCRSVLLAQNQFADFLKATPAERDKVLKGVFGLERLDEALRVARLRVDRAGLELDALAKENADAETARDALPEAKEGERLAGERLETLKQAAPKIEACAKERTEAERAAQAATSRIAELETIAREMPPQETVAGVTDAASRAGERVKEAQTAAEEAEERRKQADNTLKETEARVGDRSRFGTFAALVAQHDQQAAAVVREHERAEASAAALNETFEEVERLSAAMAEVMIAAEAAGATVEEASAAVKVRRDELLEARHAEMAFELRGALAIGEECPVCAQPIHELPRRAAAPKVNAAERILAKAEAAETKRRNEHDVVAAKVAEVKTAGRLAGKAAEQAERAHSKAEEDLHEAEAGLAATKSDLVDRLGEGDPRKLLDEREAELAAAETARDAAVGAAEEARALLEQASREAASFADQLAQVANRLAGVWGRLGEAREVPARPQDVQEAFESAAGAILERHEGAVGALSTAEQRKDAVETALTDVLESVGLRPDADFAQEMTGAAVSHTNAERDVKEFEKTIKAASKIEERIADAEIRRGLAERLAKDLQPSRFLAFLLEEERAELAELGSEHFEQLTGGNYRFTADDAFNILDVNAAATERKAESLSGGETFLASLALALALAEMVARGGGRLDAFFLDEGFGTLDPEHLDLAMDGIGILVAGREDRLVVLVSHVAEMREAIEDLVVLDKDPITGDTVVVSGARPEALVP